MQSDLKNKKMGKEIHFDVNSIIKIEIYDRKKDSHKWLPARQRTWLFGLIKRNSWQSEGFYYYGCYEECYESGCMESRPSSMEQMISYGYQIDENKTVWNKPYISILLKGGNSITKKFETIEDAKEYAEDIKEWSDIKFYIIINE
jgi:hypothetical protein